MKVTNTNSWKEKAIVIHSGKYDYSMVEYTKSYNKVKIICPLHGEFEQKAVDHLSGYGCKECGKKHNQNYFLTKAKEVHGDRYDYSDSVYNGLKKDINIICKKHGKFTTKAGVHLRGFNCPLCSVIGENEFIERSKKIHKNKYVYDEQLNYTSFKDKVTIKCDVHGYFNQRASAHTSGQGCPKCSHELNLHRRSDWFSKYNGKEVSLYVIKCFNDSETFYKIGITGNIKLRYDGKKKLPYNFEIIKQIDSFDVDYIWNLEKELLLLNKEFRYQPLIKFGGSKYECFSKINLEL